MNCKKAETFLLRSFDGILKNKEKKELEKHLISCLLCQRRRKEYQSILETLRQKDFPEPKPYFWERLQPRLKERKKYEQWSLWKQWNLRAIPLSLLLVVLLAAAVTFFFPAQKEELSQSEVLLLRNLDPFQETRTLFEEEVIENKNMMLIFTAMEENNGLRRYFP